MDAPLLVATDLDGTLLRSDLTVSDRTRAAIERVEAAGVPFVMVTGRPTRWMAPVAEVTGHRGIAVCANGAIVWDLHTEQVVADFRLSADAALAVVDALRRAVPGIAFAVEHGDVFGHEPAYKPRWDNGVAQVADVEVLLARPPVKLLARVEGAASDDLLAAARSALGDLAECTHSSDDGLLEISAAGVSKASGLAALAADHGVAARDVVAFGDMPNDLPMLAWAGWAVAVGAAHAEVLAAADEVALSNDDDGVAAVLERWF